jgi:hypothetical protein
MAKLALERVARALCRSHGHPENTTFEGQPMWCSYRDDAQAVLDALGVAALTELLAGIAGDPRVPADIRQKARNANVAIAHESH